MLTATEYLNPKFGSTENLHLTRIHSKLDLFNFVYEYEMKYFSKLIARPVCLKLINRDQTEFEEPLIYSMDFKFGKVFIKLACQITGSKYDLRTRREKNDRWNKKTGNS